MSTNSLMKCEHIYNSTCPLGLWETLKKYGLIYAKFSLSRTARSERGVTRKWTMCTPTLSLDALESQSDWHYKTTPIYLYGTTMVEIVPLVLDLKMKVDDITWSYILFWDNSGWTSLTESVSFMSSYTPTCSICVEPDVTRAPTRFTWVEPGYTDDYSL